MRVFVCGGPDFDVVTLRGQLDRLHGQHKFSTVLHDGKPGIGAAARKWADDHDIATGEHQPEWELHGAADYILAFPGLKTESVLRRARAAKVRASRLVEIR